MKVSLVVATGAHEGRVIPVTGPQFLIGRDPQCHLRPASQAISKLHCAVLVRDGKVFVQDFGSTNGTTVNDALVQGTEVAIENGTTLRVGPLDFRIRIEKAAALPDGTPLPGDSPEAAAALAAVKAATSGAAAKPAPVRDTTPNPVRAGAAAPPKSAPGAKPGSGAPPATANPGASQETPAPKAGTGETAPVTTTSESVTDEEQERMAAMLLGMDDGGNSSVPDGSTVMDIPSPLAEMGAAAKPEEKKDEKPKPAQTREEMSNAANELLRKYMRRPR